MNTHATTGKYLVARKKQWITDSARSNYLERKGIGVAGRGVHELFPSDKNARVSNAR